MGTELAGVSPVCQGKMGLLPSTEQNLGRPLCLLIPYWHRIKVNDDSTLYMGRGPRPFTGKGLGQQKSRDARPSGGRRRVTHSTWLKDRSTCLCFGHLLLILCWTI